MKTVARSRAEMSLTAAALAVAVTVTAQQKPDFATETSRHAFSAGTIDAVGLRPNATADVAVNLPTVQ